MRVIVPLLVIGLIVALALLARDNTSTPSITQVAVSEERSGVTKSVDVKPDIELNVLESRPVESTDKREWFTPDIYTEFPAFNASDAHNSEELYQPHNPLDTYETNPAKPLAALGTYVVDPKILRSLDPEGTNFSSIWEIDLNAEFMNSLEAGALFSMPDLDNTGINVILNDAEEVALMVDGVEVRFDKHSGYPLANGAGFQFNLSSWEGLNGNTQYLGGYNTRHGEYQIKSDENGAVYLLQFDPEAHRGCNHAENPHS